MERKPYAWGDELNPGGQFMANTFQGHFPEKNTKEDGHERTALVASFPPNKYGPYDMAGNVSEWTSDWYRHDYYQTLVAQGPVARNPQGPADSFDPSEPGVKKKVHRGGSFLCTDQYCARYIAAVAARASRIRARIMSDSGWCVRCADRPITQPGGCAE